MKKYIKYFLLFIFLLGSIIFMNNNQEMYNYPILRVSDIKVNNIDYQYNNNLKEPYYHETITGKILNGNYKGDVLSFDNTHSYSGVYDEKYAIGDEIFVNIEDNQISEVINLRKDKFIIPLVVLMLCLLIIVAGNKGLYTIISLFLNLGIIYMATTLRDKGANIFLLFIPISVLMSSISLLLTSGINKKTKVAIYSTVISLFITFSISYLLILIFNRDIPYWYMDYVDILYDYNEVFLVTVLISGLGAIMDIAISIVSTLNELIVNAPKISEKALLKSGTNLTNDILGTMTNVLLFTGLSGTFPMIIFVMRNNINIMTAINMYAKIELVRFLTGCIGILVTIPISMYLAIYFFKRRNK